MKQIIFLDEMDRSKILGWYPWVSDNVGMLDRQLARKLESNIDDGLTEAESTIALRWHVSIPDGFITDSDRYVASKLREAFRRQTHDPSREQEA